MQERFREFTLLIANLNRCIGKVKTEEIAGFDLKGSHVSCLYYVYENESLTAKELCDICEEDKANISRSIEYLEENGYIACHSKTEKRYKSPLVLTEKGRTVGAKITAKIDRLLSSVGEGVSEEDRGIMYQSLAIICENLQKFCDGYGENDK